MSEAILNLDDLTRAVPGRTYGRLSNRVALVVLLLVASTYVVNAMDRIVFATLLPAVSKEYGFPLSQGGLLATIFSLGLGIAGVPTGYLFDRLSRKAVAIIGIAIYSTCTVLTCFSVGFADMAAYRSVSGIGEALQNAAIFTACGAYFPNNRTLALGVLNVAYGIGSFIGPRWGASLLLHSGSWRLPLFVYGAVGLAGALLMLLFIPKRFTEQSVQSAAVRYENNVPTRLINRNTVLISIASVCGGLAGFGYLGLYPTFLRTQLHFSVQEAGAAASMYGIGALTGLLCGLMGDRLNQKWITIVTLMVLAIVGYAIFNVATTPFAQQALSFLEGSASSGFLFINNYSLMQRSVRASMTGRASGLVVSCVYLPAAASGYIFSSLNIAYNWGTAASLQMTSILVVPIVAMLFFDLSKTSGRGARFPSDIEVGGEVPS